jgi:hypothetical protein
VSTAAKVAVELRDHARALRQEAKVADHAASLLDGRKPRGRPPRLPATPATATRKGRS